MTMVDCSSVPTAPESDEKAPIRRKLPLSNAPVVPRPHVVVRPGKFNGATGTELLAILQDDADWNSIPKTAAEKSVKAEAILRRAEAAEEVRRRGAFEPSITKALIRRVRQRSLHPDWMYHGLDGAAALRALAAANHSQFIELSRECLWRDDPVGEQVLDPRFKVPRSWTDFRTKGIVFELLETFPGPATQKLCRDYLALNDDDAKQIGNLQFEPAARTLLAVSPGESTAIELLKHRRGDVRGRAIFFCLAHIQEKWARAALEQAAPHALAYTR